MQTGERCDARERNTNGCSHTFSPVYMRSRFQNLALKEKKKEEKPSNANADAGAIRFTDVHKYT